MPVPSQVINGNRYDFTSIEITFSVLGVPKVVGIKEINYKETLEPGMVYGTSADPIGRTRGQYAAEGSFTIFRAEWSDLLEALGTQPPPLGAPLSGYLEAGFDMTVSYAEDGQPTIVDRLIGCRVKSVASSNTQSKDGLVLQVDLSVMKILQNLLSPLSFPLAAVGVPSNP